ncbi:kynurenine aminotransferase, putative [Bodo saltans]|uniref:kynurenine--oxoglutarate transaminase n=1 Tax=Bodo saltans TaxID=75058 RepID=A0A0S4KNT6_BODSA|nr:kynurenine aminotransferase, putative [Bodo saltans]|eukprot:CUI14557.1 kynurenine aminotransferase, putative [Bodo saltans]
MSKAKRTLEEFAAKRLVQIPKQTVWSEMTPLAAAHKAINLGQGFPSFAPPEFVTNHIAAAVTDPNAPLNHQYCRAFGHLELVEPLRKIYAERLQREIGQMELLVTNGVTQGLNLACQAFLGPEDELLSFEPYFDLYTNDVYLSSSNIQLVPMQTDDKLANNWSFTEEALRAKITPRTKAILVNTPQNVPGKVFRRDELELIAKIAVEFDLLVFADEVYMTLVYDGAEHISIASFPGMFDRTITMSSAGKTFSCTGYKIGWMVAPEPLIIALAKVSANQTFCVATPLQIAIGRSLADATTNGYFQKLISIYEGKRELLVTALKDAGLPVVMPAGGYFALADITGIDESHYVDPNDTTDVAKDWQFCRWLTKEIGVNAIPVTAFCRKETRPQFEKFVRFAFCKKDEDIQEAGKRLQKLKEFTRK